MISFGATRISGWDEAIHGMRNPMNSWDRSDSVIFEDTNRIDIGPNDYELMMKLAKGGPAHAKYRRMIVVWTDILAPLYWWKEFDTYKVGTVANSCSTMHKIQDKEFTMGDFSCEHLANLNIGGSCRHRFSDILEDVIHELNLARRLYLETNDKRYWWQMIQLLPSSYNQKRTVMLNYEVLSRIYQDRKSHKLDEWRDFCSWIGALPHSEIITGKARTANGGKQK